MPRVSEEIVIERPPEEVFAFVTTPENDLQWISTAVERRPEGEGPLQVGSRVRAVDKFLGRRIESTFEVLEHTPPNRSAIRLEGAIPAVGTFDLEPADAGTRFRWTMDAEAGLGGVYLGRITDPLVAFFFRRSLQRDLRRLKTILESR